MDITRRIATDRIEADINGVNTVVAEPGQVVPLAYEHLVPEDKAEPLATGRDTRSTSDRAALAVALDEATVAQTGSEPVTEPKAPARGRGGRKAAGEEE